MTKHTLMTDLKVGDTLYFDDGRIAVTIGEKSGQRCKLRIVHQGVTVSRTPPAEKAGDFNKNQVISP